MITFVRSATAHDGQIGQAIEWAVRIAKYVNENIEGTNLQVVRNIGGPVYEIHWVANYESLAAFEESFQRMEADPGYRDILAGVREAEVLIGATVEDRLYESVG